ncbi:hypothetical protein [Kingella potus]|uniref:hypothetical protein n=1 Tax=Kingella potus TaxID=265175 RepID=UPI001FD2C30A|nr:hypothetical protein [Kingella potus]UOP02022.1 hypothetical protein LVJ84_14305 [Kingella potus]
MAAFTAVGLKRQGALLGLGKMFLRRGFHLGGGTLEAGGHFAEAEFGQALQHQGNRRLRRAGKGFHGNADGGKTVFDCA